MSGSLMRQARSAKEHRQLQADIDQITWYHEFDFGAGLRARSRTPDVQAHRALWRFIEAQLEAVDFRGKTVLDIGCWDGYWSFLAEQRGARRVLATDDRTQNWSDGCGIFLAKQLLGSTVEVRQDVSIYELESLDEKFDIVLCLGVYYHLIDPFRAFAQIRHCCHAKSIVMLEGDVVRHGLPAGCVLYPFAGPTKPAWMPSVSALKGLLEAAYLDVRSQTWMCCAGVVRRLLNMALGSRTAAGARVFVDRAFTTCVPREGHNPRHDYRPPFGLHIYDSRFQRIPQAKRST